MHSVSSLQKGSQRSIWEVVLHLQQMDQLGHFPTLLNYLFSVFVRVCHEFLYRFLVGKDTIFVVVFEDTQVRFSWHQ